MPDPGHSVSDFVAGVTEAIDAKIAEAELGGSADWGGIGGTLSDQTDLQAALDAKATPGDITAAITALINAAPAALDTLDELAAALGDDANFAATVTAALAGKQATLVSGTNIKTINGETILGSGDLVVTGGSGLTEAQVRTRAFMRC